MNEEYERAFFTIAEDAIGDKKRNKHENTRNISRWNSVDIAVILVEASFA